MTLVDTPARTDRFDELVERARALAAGRRRAVLGIAGAPGAGKTTVALALVRALAATPPDGLGPGWVAHVPMDGFHLADVELDRLGRRHRKGAPDTFDADGFYHTGDGGRFDDDGVLFFEGRLGDLIKTGGANVSPREVEAVLVELDGVDEAYVVGVPDRDRGEIVAAAVVTAAGAAWTAESLRARLRDGLAAYKVPKLIAVCAHDELPFTDTGKIDRRALAATFG